MAQFCGIKPGVGLIIHCLAVLVESDDTTAGECDRGQADKVQGNSIAGIVRI